MGKNLLFANLEVDNLKNKVTSKKEKEKNPNFSRMDDSQLTDITEYLKKNYLTEDDLFNELIMIIITNQMFMIHINQEKQVKILK